MFSKVQGWYSRVQVLTQECKHPPRTLNFHTCSEIVKHNEVLLRRKRLPPLVRVSLSVRTGTSELASVRLCADWRRCPRKGAEARDGPADSISFQVIGVVFLNVKTDFLNLESVFLNLEFDFLNLELVLPVCVFDLLNCGVRGFRSRHLQTWVVSLKSFLDLLKHVRGNSKFRISFSKFRKLFF